MKTIKYFLISVLCAALISCEEEEPIPTYSLSTVASPVEGGTISVSPSSASYQQGQSVTLTPQPNANWVFKQWEGDGSGATVPLSISMTSNKSVVGVFVKKDYPLNIQIEGEGTVTEVIVTNPSGREYPHGTRVELTPVPKEGWQFESWGGDLTGNEIPKQITVDKEKNVTVKFKSLPIITSLDCQSSTNNGELIDGEAAINISSTISYTGGNGGTHSGQTVTSTGVTGLTATLTAGTFANGSGSLSYTITGTPSTSGTASFALNIGGQICTLSWAVASGPTIVIDVTNPITGRTWMDRNLGAAQVATSSTDAASYGDLYQWGRRSDGHQLRNSATTTTLSSIDQPAHGSFIAVPIAIANTQDWRSPQNTNLWQGVNGVNNPCPSGYRLPTQTELNAERLSWSANTSAGAFASPLKFPVAGLRSDSHGALGNAGTFGYYWSSTFSSPFSQNLFFTSSGSDIFTSNRGNGLSVRCIKD